MSSVLSSVVGYGLTPQSLSPEDGELSVILPIQTGMTVDPSESAAYGRYESGPHRPLTPSWRSRTSAVVIATALAVLTKMSGKPVYAVWCFGASGIAKFLSGLRGEAADRGEAVQKVGRFYGYLVAGGFHTQILAGIGAMATVLGFVQFFAPDASSILSRDGWIRVTGSVAVAVLAWSAWRCWPRTRLRRSYVDSSGWSISISRGDLFTATAPIAVTCDRAPHVDPAMVGNGSLVGQLVQQWFSGESSSVAVQLNAPPAPQALFPVGTAIEFTAPGGRTGWLLCLADPATGATATRWPELTAALDGLWSAVTARNVARVTVPVIGSGFTGANLSAEAALHTLIISFHSTSLTRRVCPSLNIVVHPDDYSPEIFTSTDALLKTLRYV